MREQKVKLYLNQINLKMTKQLNFQQEVFQKVFPLFHNLIKFLYNCQKSSANFKKRNQIGHIYYIRTRNQYQNFLNNNLSPDQLVQIQKNDKTLAYMIKQSFQMMKLIKYPIKYLQNASPQIQLIPGLNFQTKKQNDLASQKRLYNKTNFQKTDKNFKNFIVQQQKKQKNYEIAADNDQIFLIANKSNNDNKHYIKKNQSERHQALTQIEKLYNQFRLDQAYQKLKFFLTQFKNDYEKTNFSNLSSSIQNQYNQMIKYHNLIPINLKKDSFKFDRQENKSIMYYKFQQKGSIQYYIEKQFENLPIETFLSISNQVMLYPRCIPFNEQSKQLKIISTNKKIGQTTISFPLLQKSVCYFHNTIYDRLQECNSVFFCCRKIQNFQANKSFDCDKVLDNVKKNIIDYKYCLAEYEPLCKNKAKVRMVVSLGVDFIFTPKLILKSSMRMFCSQYFKSLQEINKNFKGSDWQKKIKENPQFYQIFKKKIVDLKLSSQ